MPREALEEALPHFREHRLSLEALCEVMVRFGQTPTAHDAPRTTMTRLVSQALRHTVPAVSPPARTRRLSLPRLGHSTPAVKSPGPATDTTRLDHFAAVRGVTPTVHPGLDPDCPAAADPGDPRHAVGHPLGEGGVGLVRLGVDRDLRRAVAIKVLRDEYRNDPVLLQAFLEEAIITGGLEHPNIVPVHEVGISAELGPYYTMKRLDGEPLSALLSRLRREDEPGSGPARLGRYIEFFAQALRAIAYAHDRGVIHCDLKPANILIGRYGDVTVIDWGLAKVLGPAGREQARARLWSGSPGYMPPEQALSQDIDALDPRTDVWALGAILYEILTLTLPFADPDGTLPEQLSWRDFPSPVERAPDRPIPAELDRLCMRMLARAPSDRPAHVQDILSKVESWLDGSREHERRQNAASHALTEASESLREARRHEEAIDALQASPAPDLALLAATREAVLRVYEKARDAIIAGLDLNPTGAGLLKAAAALYGYTFLRLFPGRHLADAPLRERAVPLLESLHRVAFDAIVARAEAKGVPASALDPRLAALHASTRDPWLAATLRLGATLGPSPVLEDLVERIRALQEAAIFAGTPAHELLAIAEATERVAYPAGAPIFEAGDRGDALYVVLDGEVEIAREGRALSALGPLACFGEVALVDGSTRTADARASRPTRCLMLRAGRFEAILKRDGTIGLRVMRVLAERLRDATEREIARIRSA